jgi:hypothetical protein
MLFRLGLKRDIANEITPDSSNFIVSNTPLVFNYQTQIYIESVPNTIIYAIGQDLVKCLPPCIEITPKEKVFMIKSYRESMNLIKILNEQFHLFKHFENFDGLNFNELQSSGLVRIFFGAFSSYKRAIRFKDDFLIGWGIRYLYNGKVGEIPLSDIVVAAEDTSSKRDIYIDFYREFFGYQMLDFLNEKGYLDIPINANTFRNPKYVLPENLFLNFKVGIEYVLE